MKVAMQLLKKNKVIISILNAPIYQLATMCIRTVNIIISQLNCEMNYTYVTGFAKTVPIGTTIEIHFMA